MGERGVGGSALGVRPLPASPGVRLGRENTGSRRHRRAALDFRRGFVGPSEQLSPGRLSGSVSGTDFKSRLAHLDRPRDLRGKKTRGHLPVAAGNVQNFLAALRQEPPRELSPVCEQGQVRGLQTQI